MRHTCLELQLPQHVIAFSLPFQSAKIVLRLVCSLLFRSAYTQCLRCDFVIIDTQIVMEVRIISNLSKLLECLVALQLE